MKLYDKNYLSRSIGMILVATFSFLFISNSIQSAFVRQGNTINLAKEQERQRKEDAIDNRPLEQVISSDKPDRYVQTEAFLSLSKMRRLIERDYSATIIPHLNIISSIIANEQKHQNTHYVFYHVQPNDYRLTQDLYKLLTAAYRNPVPENFTYLRFKKSDSVDKTAQEWLIDELQESGLVNDNAPQVASLLLSVNLSLFANVGLAGECTWDYFLKDKGHRVPNRSTYEDMMREFGVTNKYIDDIIALADIYATKENTILQIFVPKEKIDQIGYLAWVRGIPAHQETIDMIIDKAGGKRYQKTEPVFEKLTKYFSGKGENDKIYQDMLKSVNQGKFSLESYLKVYCNKPWELDNINDVTARLLFTPDVLLDPASRVEVYRYSTTPREKMKEYRSKLNAVANKIINEKVE